MVRKIFIAFGIAIVLLVLLSGCTAPPASPINCGNETLESGEQCDGDTGACPENQICLNDCTCGIPSPPSLPA